MSSEDRVTTLIVYAFLALALMVVLFPLYFILVASVSDPILVVTGRVWLYPRGLTLAGYEQISSDRSVLTGYRNSIMYTTVGTLVNLAVTLTAAYSLSRPELPGRNVIMFTFAFTMFFSGGIVPLFIIVRGLGLYNTFWAMILPRALSVWNMIIARTFFQNTIPSELVDAAKIDGCSDWRFFASIVLPISTPIVAVLLIFYAVEHWNSFFHALIFLRESDRFPLQLVLRGILIGVERYSDLEQSFDDEGAEMAFRYAESVKYAAIVVASLPMLILYPFVQKHYVRGIMIGAIKG